MRMPFLEFITSGDLKFVIVYVIFFGIACYAFFRKLSSTESQQKAAFNLKIKHAAFWILISSVLTLLLGFMHSFYFIGKTGGIAPHLIFQGVANALVTPVMGIGLFILVKILGAFGNGASTK